MTEIASFDDEDTWNVNVAKLDGLISELHYLASDDTEDFRRVAERVFKNYLEEWGDD